LNYGKSRKDEKPDTVQPTVILVYFCDVPWIHGLFPVVSVSTGTGIFAGKVE